MKKEIDKNLVLQFQSGDKNALPELVKRWHKEFCGKAYWLVKDKEVAKDIAQESWNTIIDKIDSLKNASSFGGWAMRIVYHKSLDWLRTRSKEQLQKNEYYNYQDKSDSVIDEDEQIKQTLLKALNTLPINQQQVIKLFYVEDYALKEISELLNISVGTVKSRLFHAREKLKTILKHTKDKY